MISKDLVIIGAGPSALATAIYTTREDIPTVLYEKGVVGGMAAITDQIDNYVDLNQFKSFQELFKSIRNKSYRRKVKTF